MKVVVGARAHKMSKSRGNVINPDVIVRAYGADSLRLYEMFMGPLRETKVWSTKSVEGVHRFLARVWRIFENGALLPARLAPVSHTKFSAPESSCMSVCRSTRDRTHSFETPDALMSHLPSPTIQVGSIGVAPID